MKLNKTCEIEDWRWPHLEPLSRHRKNWEYEHFMFGLRSLGAIRPDAWVLAVGGGHEPPVFQLTNSVRWVFCTDLYDTTSFSDEADGLMLRDPAKFTTLPFNPRRLVVQYMNALDLRYEDETFDIAFSLSSIEHFGGIEGAVRALSEMRRVIRPGGVVALTTEVIVNGADDFAAENLQLFSPATLNRVIASAGLEPVEWVDFNVSPATRRTVLPLGTAIAEPARLPHIVLECAGREFTSVSLFLRRR